MVTKPLHGCGTSRALAARCRYEVTARKRVIAPNLQQVRDVSSSLRLLRALRRRDCGLQHSARHRELHPSKSQAPAGLARRIEVLHNAARVSLQRCSRRSRARRVR